MSLSQSVKGQSGGLYYAKLRNQKKNKQMDQDNDISYRDINQDISPTRDNIIDSFLQVENSKMDKDNIEYINSLLQNKDMSRESHSQHQRTKSSINSHQYDQSPISRTPNQSTKNKFKLETEAQQESKTPRCQPNQKLFDDFFKQTQNLNKEQTTKQTNYQENNKQIKKILYENNDIKPQKNLKQSTDFLKSIDGYLDQLNSQESTQSEYKIELNNSYSSKNQNLQLIMNENFKLKQQLEIQDKKYINQKILMNELNQYKDKEKESKNVINYQYQEIKNLKKILNQAVIKLQQTREQLQKEKIQHENSILTLKKVLQKTNSSNKLHTFQEQYKEKNSEDLEKSYRNCNNTYINKMQMPQFFEQDDIFSNEYTEQDENQSKNFSFEEQESSFLNLQSLEQTKQYRDKKKQIKNYENEEDYLYSMIQQMIQQKNQKNYSSNNLDKSKSSNRLLRDINLQELQNRSINN